MFTKPLTTNKHSDILSSTKRTNVYRQWGREDSRMSGNKTYRKRKKYRIKSKFRFITSMIIIIGLCATGAAALTGLSTSLALTKEIYTQVQVASGDTLWTIANTYKDENTDTREAIYEICQINDVDASDLYPGMTLSIPESL